MPVLKTPRKFEKVFHVKLGNKTLDQVRKEYKVNGMNSIRVVMPTIEKYPGLEPFIMLQKQRWFYSLLTHIAQQSILTQTLLLSYSCD